MPMTMSAFLSHWHCEKWGVAGGCKVNMGLNLLGMCAERPRSGASGLTSTEADSSQAARALWKASTWVSFVFLGVFLKGGETLWMIMGWFSFDSIKLSDFSRGGFHCFGMCLMRINLFRPRQGLPTHSAAFSFLPVEYVEMLPFVSTTCLVIRGLNDENLLRWKTALLGIIFCLCAARA